MCTHRQRRKADRSSAAGAERAAGFTLLELLVALAIMVVAFAVVWSTFSTTINAWKRGDALLDDLHHGDYVMEQLVSALRSAAFFGNKPWRYGLHFHDGGNGRYAQDRISFVTSGTAFMPPGSPLANGLHRLVVSVEDGPEGEAGLAVRAYPHLADIDDDEPDPWFVSYRVEGMDCRFYNFEDEVWEDEWEDTNAIPRLVDVQLYMEPLEEYGDPVVLRRLVEIPVAPEEGAQPVRAPTEEEAAGGAAGAGRGAAEEGGARAEHEGERTVIHGGAH